MAMSCLVARSCAVMTPISSPTSRSGKAAEVNGLVRVHVLGMASSHPGHTLVWPLPTLGIPVCGMLAARCQVQGLFRFVGGWALKACGFSHNTRCGVNLPVPADIGDAVLL